MCHSFVDDILNLDFFLNVLIFYEVDFKVLHSQEMCDIPGQPKFVYHDSSRKVKRRLLVVIQYCQTGLP